MLWLCGRICPHVASLGNEALSDTKMYGRPVVAGNVWAPRSSGKLKHVTATVPLSFASIV